MTFDIADFADPRPTIFELLGYAEAEKLVRCKKLPLYGMLRRKFSARELLARMTTLAPLAYLKRLEEIDLCGARGVNDLCGLEGSTELRRVVMWQTGLRELEALRGKLKLKQLHVWCTDISSLEPLATTPALEELSVEFTKVEDLTPLSGLRKLRHLDISGTAIATLDPLCEVPITHLVAFRTRLDPDSVTRFRATHPDCTILLGDEYPSREVRCGC